MITDFIREVIQRNERTVYSFMKDENYSLFQLTYKLCREPGTDMQFGNAVKIVRILIREKMTTVKEFLEFCQKEVS